MSTYIVCDENGQYELVDADSPNQAISKAETDHPVNYVFDEDSEENV